MKSHSEDPDVLRDLTYMGYNKNVRTRVLRLCQRSEEW